MSEIRFYHLERQSLEDILPALLSKALSGARRVVIKTPDDKETQRLSEHLWTYSPDSFLPHGTQKDGFAENQPIWLTTEDENPNNADVLILTGGVASHIQDQFSLCCEIFNGNDNQMLKEARSRWKTYKDSAHTLTYWQQGANGWEEKTAT